MIRFPATSTLATVPAIVGAVICLFFSAAAVAADPATPAYAQWRASFVESEPVKLLKKRGATVLVGDAERWVSVGYSDRIVTAYMLLPMKDLAVPNGIPVELALVRCRILPEVWEIVRQLEIEELNLYGSHLRARDIGEIWFIKGLRSLNLGDTGIRDRELLWLLDSPQLRGLERLELWENEKLTDPGLEKLTNLKHLRELYLVGTPIGDAGVKKLRGLGELRVLWLSGTRVTDEGISELQHLPDLEELNLDCTELTDACIPHLMKLKNLQVLEMSFTRITDTGREHLKSMSLRVFRARRPVDEELRRQGFEAGEPVPDDEAP